MFMCSVLLNFPNIYRIWREKRKYTDENEELSGYRKGVSVTGKLFYVLFILFLLQSLDFSTMND